MFIFRINQRLSDYNCSLLIFFELINYFCLHLETISSELLAFAFIKSIFPCSNEIHRTKWAYFAWIQLQEDFPSVSDKSQIHTEAELNVLSPWSVYLLYDWPYGWIHSAYYHATFTLKTRFLWHLSASHCQGCTSRWVLWFLGKEFSMFFWWLLVDYIVSACRFRWALWGGHWYKGIHARICCLSLVSAIWISSEPPWIDDLAYYN